MIWTMKPTAKKLEDVETKVGNVGSTDLQSQVTTLNNKVGNVGSTDLQSQITTLNSNLVNMGNLFGCVQYNAGIDRSVESNRTATMDYLMTNYFSNNYHFAVVRYAGGYYHGYIFIGEWQDILIVEITHALSEKVIFWRKNNGTWAKNGAIT